ncbi:hypothetical protein ACSLOE_30340, partial [Escherichia coli]|uniref:hypothetical protein n=1 Tax=Escherichia coli TaxID=562 RepID=UPI003EE12C7A
MNEYYQYLFQMKNWMIIVVVYLYVAEGDESRNELDEGQRQTERSETGAGVTEHDGAGKTFAERIR